MASAKDKRSGVRSTTAMNTSISPPTRTIRLTIPSRTEETPPHPRGLPKPKINFFRLMSGSDEEDAHQSEPSSLRLQAPRRTACSRGMQNIDFLIMSLRNDIRVRWFSLNDGFFLICFWTVRDAISFYRQYFQTATMAFAHQEEYDGFTLDAFTKHRIERPVYCDTSQDGFTEPFGTNGSAAGMATEAEPLPRHGGCPRAVSRPEDGERHFGGRICSLRKLDDMLQTYKSARKAGAPPPPVGERAAAKEETFRKRVDYFNRMRSFFSASDVKKMQALYEGGQRDFLFLNTKELACGSASNLLMQGVVKAATEEQLCRIVEGLGPDIAAISATKYGAYTIQALILSALSPAAQRLISCCFEPFGEFLIDHQIGNYSIQKILHFDAPLVHEMYMRRMAQVIDSPLGLKILKKCLPFFQGGEERTIARIAEIRSEHNSERCDELLHLVRSGAGLGPTAPEEPLLKYLRGHTAEQQ